MRIILVWVVAITILFIVTVGWYVSTPIILAVATGIAGSATDVNAINIITAVKYVSYVWGPLLDIFVLLWAIISSQQRDVESEIYS